MKFVKFTEHNEWEGEDWNFWLQLDGNEKELKELESWLGTFDDEGEQFEINMKETVDEQGVDLLVKYGGEGYMNCHNKVVGTFKCPTVTSENEDAGNDWLSNNFYKGDIARHFKNENEPKN